MHNNAHVFALDKAPGRDNVQAMLKRMAADKNVEYAEIDEPRRLLSQMQPWGIGTVQGDQLSDSASGNMTVCIIDSGYERANPDLNANNATGTNDSGTGNWYQNGGSHGTHVAGTIAAVNNTEGVDRRHGPMPMLTCISLRFSMKAAGVTAQIWLMPLMSVLTTALKLST